jgi:DNA-binding CsgD family transcriptional regulator
VEEKVNKTTDLEQPIFSLVNLGYGLMSSWVVCMSYVAQWSGLPTLMPGAFATLPWLVSSVAVTAALASLAALRRYIGLPSKRLPLGIVWMLAAATGSALTAIGGAAPSVIGAVLTGTGTAWLWMTWGEFFSRITAEAAERLIVAAAVLSALIVVVVSFLPHPAQVACCVAMPILCFFCGYRSLCGSKPDGCCSTNRKPVLSKRRFFSNVVLSIGVPCVIIFILRSFYTHLMQGNSWDISTEMVVNTFGAMLFLVVIVLFFRYTPAVNAHFILKWSSPLVILAAFLLGTNINPMVGASLLAAAVSIIDQFRWIFAIKIHRRTKGDVMLIFGSICALYQGFILIGALSGVGLLALDAAGLIDTKLIAAASLFVLCLVFVFFFDRKLDASTGDEDSPQLQVPTELGSVASDHALSIREREVLAYILKGRDAPYIRDELRISKNTVNTHIKHIYTKFGVHGKQELIDAIERESHPSD